MKQCIHCRRASYPITPSPGDPGQEKKPGPKHNTAVSQVKTEEECSLASDFDAAVVVVKQVLQVARVRASEDPAGFDFVSKERCMCVCVGIGASREGVGPSEGQITLHHHWTWPQQPSSMVGRGWRHWLEGR